MSMNHWPNVVCLVLACAGLGTTSALAETESLVTDCIPFGPPPKGGYASYSAAESSRAETVIPGVPGYQWQRGCAPTAIGMLLGYWDGQGFDALIPGDASIQTPEVNDAIANDLHYNDYSLPLDYPPKLLRDKSENPVGDEHESNCLADFLHTSWSAEDMYWGSTKDFVFRDGVLDYVDYVNTTQGVRYEVASAGLIGGLTWTNYVDEIDAGYPMVFEVNIDGTGTIHAVTAIGYRDDTNGDGYPEYACLDTWSPPDAIRWEQYRGCDVGGAWCLARAFSIHLYRVVCGDGICDEDEEDPCNCPADCGAPPTQEEPGLTCTDGVDNDCDGLADCDDADCASDPVCLCDNDGTCETGEDCFSCPNDCFSTSGAVCGNHVCEADDGEDCVSCPEDCNGQQGGAPGDRYCCGDGDGQGPVGCAASLCDVGGNVCVTEPVIGTCCGDGTCQGTEDASNCHVDCGPPVTCGNGTCDAGENSCNCPGDCGAPPANEVNCTDGVDEDCDGYADCDDEDCSLDPACYDPCGDGTCDVDENQCTCPEDCGTPPLTESDCGDGIDNDCDTMTDCDDHDCDADPVCGCGDKGDPCSSPFDCCSGLCNVHTWTCK